MGMKFVVHVSDHLPIGHPGGTKHVVEAPDDFVAMREAESETGMIAIAVRRAKPADLVSDGDDGETPTP